MLKFLIGVPLSEKNHQISVNVAKIGLPRDERSILKTLRS
jgi:hypothetical protein